MNKFKEYKYIYNKFQALFFINNGAKLVDIDKHEQTHNIYFKFKNNDKLQELFTAWCSR